MEAGGETYHCKYLVAAPGREGAEWFMKEAHALGLETQSNAVDIGVRVESPAEVYEPITKICYESKLVYFSRSFDDRVRTFCMNPYGFVVNPFLTGNISHPWRICLARDQSSKGWVIFVTAAVLR